MNEIKWLTRLARRHKLVTLVLSICLLVLLSGFGIRIATAGCVNIEYGEFQLKILAFLDEHGQC